MPQSIIYDIESSGLKPAHNVPLQFGAIILDASGNEVRRVNWRGRAPRNILPSPTALAVTQQRISDIMKQPVSNYELVKQIFAFFDEASPATVMGYNTIGYDDEVIRHTNYANLLPPYIIQFGGNTRCDIMLATKAAAAANPRALKLPLNAKNKRSFKLEDVATANGFNGHNAHDAMGDVEATIHMANVIHGQVPEIWRQASTKWNDKGNMLALLESGKAFVHLGWNHPGDRESVKVFVPVCSDETNPNEYICINLDADVSALLPLSPSSLKPKFRSQKGVTALKCIKANAMPTIIPANSQIARDLGIVVDQSIVQQIHADPTFADRVRAANTLRKSEYKEPTHVREQLYSGGFFPITQDADLFDRFHAAPPAMRWEIAQQFSDPRAKVLARWLIGSEWPDVMPQGERASFEDELREHLMLESAEWVTIPAARAEIADILCDPDLAPQTKLIVTEYDAHLRALESSWVQASHA